MTRIRNVAIIAHVDHGKTTLVDALLRQSKTNIGKEIDAKDLIMDSNELERERGITIFSKNASVVWSPSANLPAQAGATGDKSSSATSSAQGYGRSQKATGDKKDDAVKINIIDTPGHADFGGEVERVLNMADGCLLLVDAKEGPMPQTRFVLKKALEMGLRIIVVINKIDKPDARPDFVLDATFDLFVELGANDKTLDFPVIYAAAKHGKAGNDADLSKMEDITPIFDAILDHIPAPICDESKPLQILVTTVSYDNFRGRIAIGRIHNGRVKAGQEVTHINREGVMKKYRLVSLMTFVGLGRVDIDEAVSGDIVALAGIPEVNIGETIADPENASALPLLSVEEPTVKMTFMINDSPFAGREGQFSTSRQIQERLARELESDMALKVENDAAGNWTVSGRGELHLAILIERMRREGYELQISRPQVINKQKDGKTLTPFERVYIEVPEQHNGTVIQKLGSRKGELRDMRTVEGITYLEFIIPTRGLFGYRSEFLTDSRGLGIINASFYQYDVDPNNWEEKEHGSLIAHETGTTHLYGMVNVQDRGVLFIGPGVEVYEGMVVGENSRAEDIRVNVCKEKQLSNMRSKGEGGMTHFNKPKEMDLEDALEFIGDDELVEVTPKTIRIRKIYLDEISAKRMFRNNTH